MNKPFILFLINLYILHMEYVKWHQFYGVVL